MDMEKMNNVQNQAKGACKKYWKKGLAAALALAILGGAGAVYDVQQHKAERAARDAARSQLVASQAARENVTLISEDEAKAKAAEAVGIDESSLTFKSVGLENLALQKGDKKDGDKKEKFEKKSHKEGGKHSEDWYKNHDNHDSHDRDDHERDNHDGYDHDGMQHMAQPQGMMPGQSPQGMAPQGAPQNGMMQPPQGQPPMMQGQQNGQQQGAQATQTSADTQQAQPQQAADGQQPPHDFRFHPAYKIACSHGDVKYHVMVDAVTGDVMTCDVV
ncbi:MAG: hypothetical protein MSA50_00710 [Veillonellaceae bacterium]|nr:hypothetical protein [Veillonellaceae bacterium]